MHLVAEQAEAWQTTKRVVIPGVFLKLAVAGRVYGTTGDEEGRRPIGTYVVDGLSREQAERLARQAETDLLARLKEAGWQVEDYTALATRPEIREILRAKPDRQWGLALDREARGHHVYLMAAPQAEQAYASGLGAIAVAPFLHGGRSLVPDALLLLPSYEVFAPQTWTEVEPERTEAVSGFWIAPGLDLASVQFAFVTPQGKTGMFYTQRVSGPLAAKVGTLTLHPQTPPPKAYTAALNRLTRLNRTVSEQGHFRLQVDPAAYEAAVVQAYTAANRALVEALPKAP